MGGHPFHCFGLASLKQWQSPQNAPLGIMTHSPSLRPYRSASGGAQVAGYLAVENNLFLIGESLLPSSLLT